LAIKKQEGKQYLIIGIDSINRVTKLLLIEKPLEKTI